MRTTAYLSTRPRYGLMDLAEAQRAARRWIDQGVANLAA